MQGRVEARLVEPEVLELTFTGAITPDVMARAISALQAQLVGRTTVRYIVVDASQVSSFSVSIREQGIEMVRLLKEFGLRRAIAVYANAALRMFSLALSFACNLPTEAVATRDEAMARVAELKESSSELRAYGST
jgi:hypothetical protein